MTDTNDPAREVLRGLPSELAIDCALRWRGQRDEAITQRDQVAHERDALRAEVEKMRSEVDGMKREREGIKKIREQARELAKACGVAPDRLDITGGPEHAEAVTKEVAAEFARLRAEVESLRAARPAPLGDKVRELVELSRLWLNAYPQRSFWTSEYARRFYDLMRQFPTDADLAPDPVVQECVEACIAHDAYRVELKLSEDDPMLAPTAQRVMAAGRAARAKGGA